MTNTWPQLESTHNTIVSSTTARCQRSYRERDFKQCFCTVVMRLGCTHIATGLMCCKAALTVRKIGVKCSIFRADHSTIRSRTRVIKGGSLALTFMKSKKNLFKTIRTRLKKRHKEKRWERKRHLFVWNTWFGTSAVYGWKHLQDYINFHLVNVKLPAYTSLPGVCSVGRPHSHSNQHKAINGRHRRNERKSEGSSDSGRNICVRAHNRLFTLSTWKDPLFFKPIAHKSDKYGFHMTRCCVYTKRCSHATLPVHICRGSCMYTH